MRVNYLLVWKAGCLIAFINTMAKIEQQGSPKNYIERLTQSTCRRLLLE